MPRQEQKRARASSVHAISRAEKHTRTPPRNALNISPNRDDINLWTVALTQSSKTTTTLCSVLSVEERERAARFLRECDRNRFIATRATLRHILSSYVGAAPERLVISCATKGKPYLRDYPSLHFNVSHSHHIAIIGVTLIGEIGVDVKLIRPIDDRDRIASRFFSSREYAELTRLPAMNREAAFFNCWTRKEAYVKAIGEGLGFALDSFDVSLDPAEPARFLGFRGSDRACEWSLFHLQPRAGYVGAVALRGPGNRLQCWHRTYNVSE